jgi:hypothetical protein
MRGPEFGPESESQFSPELSEGGAVCFGEACPQFAENLASSFDDSPEAVVQSCRRFGGASGQPGDENFQCGILDNIGLHSEGGPK